MTREELFADIADHPEKHRHSFEDLYRCSTVNGSLDCGVLIAHKSVGIGEHAGVKCDVIEGPCSCGASHRQKKGEKP